MTPDVVSATPSVASAGGDCAGLVESRSNAGRRILQRKIRNPSADIIPQYEFVTVVPRDQQAISGIRLKTERVLRSHSWTPVTPVCIQERADWSVMKTAR